MAKTTEELFAMFEQIAQAQTRTEAVQAETSAQLKENAAARAKYEAAQAIAEAKTDARINKLAALYGGVSDNLGSAAEEFFFNSLKANPVIGGIKYDRVTPHLVVGNPGHQAEFDLVLVNGNSVALIEVKHKAQLSALDQLEKQIVRYRASFPEHASYKLYAGVAGMSVPDDTVEEAHKRGIFVLKQQGKVFAVDTQGMKAF